MSRSGVFWFAAAGGFAIARWALDFAEIQYYDPESVLDYSGVLLQTAAGLTTGVALLVLWHDPPVRRGAFLIGLGGLAAIVQGLGNLFEDAFGWGWGVWGFFVGGIGMVITLALAGIPTVSVSDPLRWAGIFLLLGATGGTLGLGLLIMGISWITFSFWINGRVRVLHRAPAG